MSKLTAPCVIRVDGTVELVVPVKGKHFTLKELQGYVGGYIELLSPWLFEEPDWCVFIDEDGRMKNKLVNHAVTMMLTHPPFGGLVGDVLFVRRGQVG